MYVYCINKNKNNLRAMLRLYAMHATAEPGNAMRCDATRDGGEEYCGSRGKSRKATAATASPILSESVRTKSIIFFFLYPLFFFSFHNNNFF